jgi:epoxyqueuosine reductase
MKKIIQEAAYKLGFDDCRITAADAPSSAPAFERWLAAQMHGEMAYLARNAFKRVEPGQVLPGIKSVVSLAVSYAESEPKPEAVPGPGALTGVIARYARYRDYHEILRHPLEKLTAFVNQHGGQGTRSLWYVDTGPILERDLAQRAGIGFVGKHTNLISRKIGNWFFICEILTTAALEPDTPERNRCGTCTRCISACPTGAIIAPFQLDARKCISYLTIELKGSIPVDLRKAIGKRIYGCDDCLAVCPWNRFSAEASLMREHRRPDLATADLLALLALSDAEFKARFAGTPMLRTKRRGLLRNVCVALGNIGDESALPALERAAADPEALIAEHARWAITQIEVRIKAAGVMTA